MSKNTPDELQKEFGLTDEQTELLKTYRVARVSAGGRTDQGFLESLAVETRNLAETMKTDEASARSQVEAAVAHCNERTGGRQ